MAKKENSIFDLEQSMIDLSISLCNDAAQRKSSLGVGEVERIKVLTDMYKVLKENQK